MYSYLIWCVLLGTIWLALYIIRKDLRYEIMFASLLFLPFGLTQPLFVPDYWNPTVIYKLWGLFDIESLLFGFFLGGIAASLYEEIFNYHLRKFGKTLTNKNYARIIYGSMIAFALFLIFIKIYT